MTQINPSVEKVASEIQSALTHRLQVLTISTKDQSEEYRKGLRDMRYLVMENTAEVCLPFLTARDTAHKEAMGEMVREILESETTFDNYNNTRCYQGVLVKDIKAIARSRGVED